MKIDKEIENPNNCSYKANGGSTCRNIRHATYDYCKEHLVSITTVNVQEMIRQLIVDELGVTIGEVTQEASIVDDLGADSLEVVELIMAFEACFDLDIPDDDYTKITTVEDARLYILKRLLRTEQYIIEPNPIFGHIFLSVQNSPDNITRIRRVFLETELCRSIISEFHIDRSSLERVFTDVLRNNWINHITVVPDCNDAGNMIGIHLLLLCKKILFHFQFQEKVIQFYPTPLDQLRLFSRITVNNTGQIEEVQIVNKPIVEGSTDDKVYEFRQEVGVAGALRFMSKYLENLEALDGS